MRCFFLGLVVGAATFGSGCSAADPVVTTADGSALDVAGDAGLDAPDAAEVEDSQPAGPSTLDFAVDAPGPFNVGYRTWDVTYTPVGVGADRTIPVHVWYPTDATEGDSPLYLGLLLDDQVVVDAPLAAPVDATSYPVLVHSHGHQGYAANTGELVRYLATHGWVVVAPDHVGDTLTDVSDADTVAHYLKRPQDISQALDALAADPELALADTSRVVLSGHSRGVYTVWASAGSTYDVAAIAADRPDATADELSAFAAGFRDERVIAALPLAGSYRQSWFGATGYTSVAVPILVMTGSADNPDNSQQQWETIEGIDFTWVDLAGGCHQTFGIGGCATLEDAEGFAIVNTMGLAFARHHLLGDGSVAGIIDGSTVISDKATVQVKTP